MKPISFNLCHTRNADDEVDVMNNQSVPLAAMGTLTAQGRAISQASLEGYGYYDSAVGITNTGQVPLENMRGVDENILFAAACDAKDKIKTWRKKLAKQKSDVGTNTKI